MKLPMIFINPKERSSELRYKLEKNKNLRLKQSNGLTMFLQETLIKTLLLLLLMQDKENKLLLMTDTKVVKTQLTQWLKVDYYFSQTGIKKI